MTWLNDQQDQGQRELSVSWTFTWEERPTFRVASWHALGPIVNVGLHCACRSGRSHFWPNTNRTVIDGKIVVSSADDGTIKPVCTHCWFTWCFTRMISTRNIIAPGHFGEHLYQQKSWVPLAMIIDNRWC